MRAAAAGHAPEVRLRLATLREYLGTSLWFVPVVCVVGAVVAAQLTLEFDAREHAPSGLLFSGSPDSARSVLTAIAGSIITLTALVFSVTIVVLQLASSQYSPRVLRSFLRDRRSQAVLGVFLGTFAYTMLVLRAVRGGDGEGDGSFVPAISVHVAFLLTGATLLFFVFYVHHVAQSMQASSIVADVAAEGREAIERLYPDIGDDAPTALHDALADGAVPVTSERSGYLQAIDEGRLFELAREWDTTIELLHRIGDFVPEGTPLARLGTEPPDEDALRACVTMGSRRTTQQDPAFAFRQLVDVGEKALSPGVNDPTTAVEAIDRLHELLVALAPRSIPSAVRSDGGGQVRLILPRPSWETFVRLAFDELRHYGEGSIQVSRRLRSVIESLLGVVPPARRRVLEEQRELLDRMAERGFTDEADVARARTADGRE